MDEFKLLTGPQMIVIQDCSRLSKQLLEIRFRIRRPSQEVRDDRHLLLCSAR